jgi:putative NIF3 family GTP cyclohydrolase 1 type 2
VLIRAIRGNTILKSRILPNLLLNLHIQTFFMSNNKNDFLQDQNRRNFLGNTLKIAGGAALVSIPGILMANEDASKYKTYTVQEIMDIVLKEVPGAPFKQTVDTLKSGRPDQVVTGIITTMFATIDIINLAIKNKANFIIAHEPSFYNHQDDTKWVTPNDVLKQKQDLLEKHQIVIWRFHDYCHALRPDAVSYGVAKKANWLSYYKTGEVMLKIPPVKLQNLVQHLKTSLGISKLRIIGDLSQTCERIALLPGAWGGQRQVSTAEEQKPDVLIVGEIHEWETGEYIRDARSFGSKTSLIILGHCVSEEPGMEYMVEWLTPRLPGVNIKHIASGDPFTFV